MSAERQVEGLELALQICLEAERKRQPVRRFFNDATVGLFGGSLLGASGSAVKYFAEGNVEWSLLSIAVGLAGASVSIALVATEPIIENHFLRLSPEDETRFKNALQSAEKPYKDERPPQNPPPPPDQTEEPPFRPFHPSGYPVKPTSGPPTLDASAAVEEPVEEKEPVYAYSTPDKSQ